MTSRFSSSNIRRARRLVLLCTERGLAIVGIAFRSRGATEGSDMADKHGSFPVAGPVTYMTDDPVECRRLMDDTLARFKTWFHGTSEHAARLSCVQGIAPGCWIGTGGECCGVLGHDSLDCFLERRRHLWILEIVSPAIDGDVKAWWVPSSCIRGVWHLEQFYWRDDVAATCVGPLSEPIDGCGCPLSPICIQQQALWRRTWYLASTR